MLEFSYTTLAFQVGSGWKVGYSHTLFPGTGRSLQGPAVSLLCRPGRCWGASHTILVWARQIRWSGGFRAGAVPAPRAPLIPRLPVHETLPWPGDLSERHGWTDVDRQRDPAFRLPSSSTPRPRAGAARLHEARAGRPRAAPANPRRLRDAAGPGASAGNSSRRLVRARTELPARSVYLGQTFSETTASLGPVRVEQPFSVTEKVLPPFPASEERTRRGVGVVRGALLSRQAERRCSCRHLLSRNSFHLSIATESMKKRWVGSKKKAKWTPRTW